MNILCQVAIYSATMKYFRKFRAFGGEVSWSATQAVGCSYPETDEKITHQIVDRPTMATTYISR